MFGFLCPIRFFSDRMASFGCTVLLRIVSEISRFKVMSSLRDGELVSPPPLPFQESGGLKRNAQTGRRGFLDLLVEVRVRRAEPGRHGEGKGVGWRELMVEMRDLVVREWLNEGETFVERVCAAPIVWRWRRWQR